jgi:hypothetical protein
MMTAADDVGGSGDLTSPGPPAPDQPAGADPSAPDQVTRVRTAGIGVLAAGGIALGMHLTVGAAYTLTLLLAPVWVSIVVAVWWLVLLLVGLALLARRSLFVLAVPLVAIVSWSAFISAGRTWLGWP